MALLTFIQGRVKVLALKIWCKEQPIPHSVVKDEETMRPADVFSVIGVSGFKNTCAIYAQRFSSGTDAGRKTIGN